MFRLHRYKSNVEKVLSGRMNNVKPIEYHFIRSISTVCKRIISCFCERLHVMFFFSCLSHQLFKSYFFIFYNVYFITICISKFVV